MSPDTGTGKRFAERTNVTSEGKEKFLVLRDIKGPTPHDTAHQPPSNMKKISNPYTIEAAPYRSKRNIQNTPCIVPQTRPGNPPLPAYRPHDTTYTSSILWYSKATLRPNISHIVGTITPLGWRRYLYSRRTSRSTLARYYKIPKLLSTMRNTS